MQEDKITLLILEKEAENEALQEGRRKWREELGAVIDKLWDEFVKDIYPNQSMCRITNKLYGMLSDQARYNLIYILSNVDNTDAFGVALSLAWTHGYHGSILRAYKPEQLIWFFKLADENTLMNEKEREVLKNLPDVVKAYRGVPFSAKSKKGLSWTLSLDVAEIFSKRIKETQSGVVLEKDIPKSSILAYLNARQEEELIIDL